MVYAHEEWTMPDDRIPMTREGYEKLKTELSHFNDVKMIEITKRVATAREMGDLSENAEYHAAREDQGMLQAQIDLLRSKLALAMILDPALLPKDVVVFGTRVVVKDLDGGDNETFELVGDVGQVAHDLEDALANGPEELFDARACFQIEDAEVEGGDRFFLDLERVVVGLLEVLPGDALVGLVELLDDLVLVAVQRRGNFPVEDLVGAEDVEDQRRVVRDERATRLGDDVGMRNVGGGAGLGDLADNVARVLLQRVVHR